MTLGVIIGIISGILFSLFSVFNRMSVSHYPALTTTFLQEALSSLLLFPIILTTDLQISLADVIKLLILGIVFTALSHSLYIKAMEKIKAQAISIIASLEPVYATILAFLILSESIEVKTVIGGGIIVLMAIISSNEKVKSLIRANFLFLNIFKK